jgi:two-component system response regulator YesN
MIDPRIKRKKFARISLVSNEFPIFAANPLKQKKWLLSRNDKKTDPRIITAIDYIDKNYDKKISLKEISQISGLGTSHFCFLFKTATGMCFSRYLKLYRMKKAKVLLESTDLLIKQIAYQVGYHDISNFNHDFKETYGTSPSKYRKLFVFSKLVHQNKKEF